MSDPIKIPMPLDQQLKLAQIIIRDLRWSANYWREDALSYQRLLNYERRVTRKLKSDLNTVITSRRMGN